MSETLALVGFTDVRAKDDGFFCRGGVEKGTGWGMAELPGGLVFLVHPGVGIQLGWDASFYSLGHCWQGESRDDTLRKGGKHPSKTNQTQPTDLPRPP